MGVTQLTAKNLSLIKGPRPSMELESEMWPNLVKKETLKWLDLKSVPLLSC